MNMNENNNNQNMDDFISGLARDLKPVKKLPPVKWRTLWFILSQIIVIPLVMKAYSSLQLSDFHWDSLEHDPFFISQIILMFDSLISSVVVGLVSILPGRYKPEYLWVPIISIILLIASITVNYLSLSHIHTDHRSMCMVEVSLLGFIPFFFMLKMVKKGFFISENTTLFLGAFASALFPTIIMHFTCSTHPTHVFVFHFIPLFLFAFLAPKIYLKFFK